MLSLVIPALQAERVLTETLTAVAPARASGLVAEVILVDGGSTDRTAEIAAAYGCRVLTAPRGRGGQLAAGAAAASGAWLLFLHADTRLAPGWTAAVAGFIETPANRQRAAAFRFTLDDTVPAARRLERLVAWRCRAFGLPYGDQGLLLARSFYEALGGFRPLPLMEDVDLVRRIGRRRLTLLDAAAITSAQKFRRGGYWRRPVRNLGMLGLYFIGVPPRILARFY